MARIRRTYTPEFKTEAVKLVTEQGYSVAEAARPLGLSDNLLRNWKQALEAKGELAFPGQGKLSPFEEENRRLRAENKRLLAERDILKKAAAFFAKEAIGPSASSRSTVPGGRCVCSATRSKSRPPATTPGATGRPARQERRDALVVEIRAVHAEVKARYGSPRIHAELAARGRDCCVNTVAKLMRDNGIRAKTARQFRQTTDSNHDLPVAENLLDRRFDPEEPNERWVADITYIPTREGWLYLAAVGTCTPGGSSAGPWPTTWRAASWSTAGAGRATAPAGRRAAPRSDRAYNASEHYRLLLARHGIACGMSRGPDGLGQRPDGKLFRLLKKELVHDADFATRPEARAAIVEYIEIFYNTKRRHSSLGYVSPAEYEQTE